MPHPLERQIDRWLFAPVKNAAGRLGLFRIVFALFYLWALSVFHLTEMADYPTWAPPVFFRWTPRLPAEIFAVAEPLLVVCLVLLLVGWRVRAVGILVFLIGGMLAAQKASIIFIERTSMMPMVYVPLFMMFSRWGETYSLDALLRQRRGLPATDPHTPDGRYFWPARALMVVLAFLFFTSGFYKLLPPGGWLADDHFLGDFLLYKSMFAYTNTGLPLNPLNPFIASTPLLSVTGVYVVMFYETTFPLVLVSRFFRGLYFRIAPLFHSFNNFFLGISVALVISIYLAFIDWQALYDEFYPRRLRLTFLQRIPTLPLIGGAALLAILIGATWNTTPIPRAVFSLGGLLNHYTIWGGVLAGALIWYGLTIRDWLRSRRVNQPEQALSGRRRHQE